MKKPGIYHIRITLKGAQPPIWRRVAVPSDITLGRLHEVIQIVMGWTDSHLHQFVLRDKGLKPSLQEMAGRFQQDAWDDGLLGRMRGERHFVPGTDPMGGPMEIDGEDEDAVTLAEVCPKFKNKLAYEYDFGDGWMHTIEVQKIVEPEPDAAYPVCLAGKKACPPEDCGGVWGYYEMLEAVADTNHERHEELLEWLGDGFDPDAFDLTEINAVLARWRKG